MFWDPAQEYKTAMDAPLGFIPGGSMPIQNMSQFFSLVSPLSSINKPVISQKKVNASFHFFSFFSAFQVTLLLYAIYTLCYGPEVGHKFHLELSQGCTSCNVYSLQHSEVSFLMYCIFNGKKYFLFDDTRKKIIKSTQKTHSYLILPSLRKQKTLIIFSVFVYG